MYQISCQKDDKMWMKGYDVWGGWGGAGPERARMEREQDQPGGDDDGS